MLALIASGVSGIASVVLGLCGLDDYTSCPTYYGPLAVVLLLLAMVLFMATSPAAGVPLRRWWAWLMPVWILVGAQLASVIATALVRL